MDVKRGCARALAAVAVVAMLGLSGCGKPPADPTATRSDRQADQLRERLRRGQGAT